MKAININGMAVIHMATISGKPDLVELLIINGVKVDTRTERGFTPMHYAARTL